MAAISRSRWASALVVVLLVGIHALPLVPALGLSDCFCDETMCVHRHRHAGDHAEGHGGASPAAAGVHCDLAAKTAPDCTMRGCSHDGDQALPSLGLGALPASAAMVVPEGVSGMLSPPSPPLLDRVPSIETPPPDTFPV